ncbi:MAG TPA: hypothetical protein VNJ07_14690 [Chitinophagales bacterium]|nr:hypothetical protein [Chitinophagales bacterium]
MKLKIVLMSGLLLIMHLTNAQKKSAIISEALPKDEFSRQKLFEHFKSVYDNAIKYSDFVVAREAIYNMLTLYPEKAGLKDTLTYLYYKTGSHVQVILLGKEILSVQPDKSDILELVAVSQQNLNLLKDALENFERLFALTKDVYHQYNIASLQYMLKRYGECSENLNAIIASTDSMRVVTIFDNTGESQQVPIKAAAFNMRGVIALEINQADVAKQNFQKAIELFPQFSLAKSNLEKIHAQESKPASGKKN